MRFGLSRMRAMFWGGKSTRSVGCSLQFPTSSGGVSCLRGSQAPNFTSLRVFHFDLIAGGTHAEPFPQIAPDGHCMFNAISDQLYLLGIIPSEETSSPVFARRSAARYMLKHQDDFIAFLPGVNGEDMVGATAHDGILTEKEFQKYCRNIEETGDWGGEPEVSVSFPFFPSSPSTRWSQGFRCHV